MEKIRAGALGAVPLSGALVATAGPAAQADPYPARSHGTTVTAPAKINVRKKPQSFASVPVSGSAAPTGSVTFVVSGKLDQTLPSSGNTVCFEPTKVKKVKKKKKKRM